MLPLLAACTHRQVYDSIQQNRQLECAKLQGGQYQQCMEEYSEPYATYERERQALINAPEQEQ